MSVSYCAACRLFSVFSFFLGRSEEGFVDGLNVIITCVDRLLLKCQRVKAAVERVEYGLYITIRELIDTFRLPFPGISVQQQVCTQFNKIKVTIFNCPSESHLPKEEEVRDCYSLLIIALTSGFIYLWREDRNLEHLMRFT